MPSRPRRCPSLLATLAVGLHALCAHAQTAEHRAVMQPAPALEIGYEHLAPDVEAPGPGRIDGALATPTGTLRTTVHVPPNGEQRWQRGDTSFELPAPVLPGQLQLRGLEAGGTVATWRAPLGGITSGEARAERSSSRTGHALQLQQDLGGGEANRALLEVSSTAATEGSRWDLEWTRYTGLWRWTFGVDAAERGYVSTFGGMEPRTGLRLGTQWPIAAGVRMEVRYARQERWDTDSTSALMLGTQLALPRRASLTTGLEVDGEARSKAMVTLTVPLEVR